MKQFFFYDPEVWGRRFFVFQFSLGSDEISFSILHSVFLGLQYAIEKESEDLVQKMCCKNLERIEFLDGRVIAVGMKAVSHQLWGLGIMFELQVSVTCQLDFSRILQELGFDRCECDRENVCAGHPSLNTLLSMVPCEG